MNTTSPNLRKVQLKQRSLIDHSIFLATVLGILLLLGLYLVAAEHIPKALWAGLFVYMGIVLPKHHLKCHRFQRAQDAKNSENAKWGFYSRDREGPWIYSVDGSVVVYTSDAESEEFYSEWLVIYKGFIIVNPGNSEVDLNNQTVSYDFAAKRTYVWDGCSPKFWFYWLLIFGTPDGWEKLETINTLHNQKIFPKTVIWQKALHASLIHDALYQYLHVIPLDKGKVDQLFFEMLKNSGFPLWRAKLYKFAVKYFGGTKDDAEKISPLPSLTLSNRSEAVLSNLKSNN